MTDPILTEHETDILAYIEGVASNDQRQRIEEQMANNPIFRKRINVLILDRTLLRTAPHSTLPQVQHRFQSIVDQARQRHQSGSTLLRIGVTASVAAAALIVISICVRQLWPAHTITFRSKQALVIANTSQRNQIIAMSTQSATISLPKAKTISIAQPRLGFAGTAFSTNRGLPTVSDNSLSSIDWVLVIRPTNRDQESRLRSMLTRFAVQNVPRLQRLQSQVANFPTTHKALDARTAATMPIAERIPTGLPISLVIKLQPWQVALLRRKFVVVKVLPPRTASESMSRQQVMAPSAVSAKLSNQNGRGIVSENKTQSFQRNAHGASSTKTIWKIKMPDKLKTYIIKILPPPLK